MNDVLQCLLTLLLEIFNNHFLTMIMYFPIALTKSDSSSLFSFHQKRNATVPATMACDKTETPLSHTPTSYYFSVTSSEQTAQSVINATFYDNGLYFLRRKSNFTHTDTFSPKMHKYRQHNKPFKIMTIGWQLFPYVHLFYIFWIMQFSYILITFIHINKNLLLSVSLKAFIISKCTVKQLRQCLTAE